MKILINFRAVIKLCLFLCLVLSYFICATPYYFIGLYDRYKARKLVIGIVQFHARLTLRLLGVKYYVRNKRDEDDFFSKSHLIVGNHLSYLDVIIYAAYFKTCFVTSIEMKRTPFLGQLCEAAGCLYVERRSRKNLSQEIMDITYALQTGLNVVVYPEATSTNGDEVKRFKRPLFQAAIDSGVDIQPVTINYNAIDFEPVTRANRDTICWYGDMGFLPHFWELLKKSIIEVDLDFTDHISEVRNKDINELAFISHSLIDERFIPLGGIQ